MAAGDEHPVGLEHIEITGLPASSTLVISDNLLNCIADGGLPLSKLPVTLTCTACKCLQIFVGCNLTHMPRSHSLFAVLSCFYVHGLDYDA